MNVYSITDASGEALSTLEVNELLEEIGISSDAIKDGTEAAIEKDAESHHIDLTLLPELAKKEFKGNVGGSADSSKQDYQTQLQALGIPDAIIAKGNDAIQDYASKNGIILPPSSGTALNLKV